MSSQRSKTKIWRVVFLSPVLFLPLLFTSGTTACSSATGGCCKVCTTGKACGDTCIARDKTCTVGAGCACNG